MRSGERLEPRTFFLNEIHELSREERSGGGGIPKLAPIDWALKTPRLTRSLRSVGRSLEDAEDPLAGHRYFFLTVPESSVTKLSSDPKKAPTGEYEEVVHFSGEHSSALHRIGLDLLGITDQGSALVHATKERFDRLASLASQLPELGMREQSRWSTIHDFEIVPATERVDSGWVDSLEPKVGTETVIELQPLLTRVEAERVVRKVLTTFRVPNVEKIRATGFDFSGRIWFRCALLVDTIKRIAGTFFSIQSIHPPLTAPISINSRPRKHQRGSVAASRRGLTKKHGI
jgi:hypothetical protein